MFGRYKYIDIKMPALKSYLRENEDEKAKGRERERERVRSSDEFWS